LFGLAGAILKEAQNAIFIYGVCEILWLRVGYLVDFRVVCSEGLCGRLGFSFEYVVLGML